MSRTEAAPRFATPRNPNRLTLGRKVGKVMGLIDPPRRLDGIRGPMPWQQDALDVACEIDPATGLFFYREVVIIVPRQAGKTSLSRGKVTHRCITTPRSPVLYTAQDRNMARRRLEKSFLEPLTDSALAAYLAPPGQGGKLGWDGANGREKVKWRNGSEIFIIAAQKKTAGHGDTLPEAHLDEYFAQVDGRLEQAIGPTMITVPGAQRWVTSAAGDSSSVPLWAKVEAGRARCEAAAAARGRGEIPLESRTCYIEYSAPPEADRTDPDAIATTHPAVDYTITVDDVLAEQTSMDSAGPEEWDRAYFGWWPSARSRPWAIPKGAWEDTSRPGADVEPQGEPVWSVDISPDRRWFSIGMAAALPGVRCWLEVPMHDEIDSTARDPGPRVVPMLRGLADELGGQLVGVDGSGPAAALIPDLEAAGFTVDRLSRQEVVDACGGLYDDVLAGYVLHEFDPDVDASLASAATRNSGEAWLFVRGRSTADISPVYAMTIARAVYVKHAGEHYDPLNSIG